MSDQAEDEKGVYKMEEDINNSFIDFVSMPSSQPSFPPLPSSVPLTPTPVHSAWGTVSKATVSDSASSSKSNSSMEKSSSTMIQSQAPVSAQLSALNKVFMSSESYRFCLTQCLSTEVEEVMGLLIGHVDEENGYCYVTHSLPLKRLDKRKDRVEIGIEQLASAFGVVEELTNRRREQHMNHQDQNSIDREFPCQLSVVGWYHSHPHITVFPSDVDIATHNQYQSTMSKHWLGLIFGVFNYDEATATNRFQLIAFQSVDKGSNGLGGRGLKHVVIPISIEARLAPTIDEWALKKAAVLIDLLLEEEKEAFLMHQGNGRGESMASHYNVCVYSKAVAKIIALLGAPMMDVLKKTKETNDRLMRLTRQL